MLPGAQGDAGEQGLGDGSKQRPVRDLAALHRFRVDVTEGAAEHHGANGLPLKVRLKVKGCTGRASGAANANANPL